MSITHILLIAVVALILFGPNKLPELGRALGRTLRDFKKGANDLMSHVDSPEQGSGPTPGPNPVNIRKDVTPSPSSLSSSSTPESSPRSNTDKNADSRRLPE